MAGLNREFLMPYLQNICSLHLARRKIEQKMRKINHLIFEAENGITIERPQRKEYVPEKNCAYYALNAAGCAIAAFCMMFFALNILGDTRIAVPWVVSGVAVGLLLLVLQQLFVSRRRRINTRMDEEYTLACEQYCQAVAEAKERTSKTLATLKLQMQGLEREDKQADKLLQMAYAVDLIPMAYRNIYYAVYLYEWICTSRSGDLSQAIRSFDPKNGKVKLEYTINNQTDAILVHTKAVSNQYRTLVMQKRLGEIHRAKVEEMVCNAQERAMYSNIVDVNVAAGAFFATATI